MEDLETQLSQLVKKGIEVAEKTGQFVIDQAPELIQEFYRWHIAKNTITIVISLILILVAWKIFKVSGKKERPQKFFDDHINVCGKYYNEHLFPFYAMTLGLVSLIALWYFVRGIYNIVFMLTAPKLYLIEHFIHSNA